MPKAASGATDRPPSLPSRKEVLILGLLGAGRELYGLELVEASGGDLKRGTVYVTLNRMEEKGYVSSRMDASTVRPGLPLRLYKSTALGRRMLSASRLLARRFNPAPA
jgi:DNA-binding PadR family transcriptional regulator